jgi:hypothetical protein
MPCCHQYGIQRMSMHGSNLASNSVDLKAPQDATHVTEMLAVMNMCDECIHTTTNARLARVVFT